MMKSLYSHSVFGVIVFLLSFGTSYAYGHTSIDIDKYEIQVGWEIEPPIVGIKNNIVLKITEPGETQGSYKGVTNAFKDVNPTVYFGGASKKIDVNSDPRPGYYFSPIIPTKTGTYMMELKGNLRGTPIDVKISVEDVEPTAVLDFPSKTSSYDNELGSLQNSIKYIQNDIRTIKSNPNTTTIDGNTGFTNGFSILAISLSVSAIMIGIISMLKQN